MHIRRLQDILNALAKYIEYNDLDQSIKKVSLLLVRSIVSVWSVVRVLGLK